jgi:hypothetical protein
MVIGWLLLECAPINIFDVLAISGPNIRLHTELLSAGRKIMHTLLLPR